MDLLVISGQIKTKLMMMLVWVLLLPFVWCVEEYQREIYLAPRNYNPHPFEHQLANIQDTGPVRFPVIEEQESAVNNRYNIITVDSERTEHLVDNNPYSKVAEKIKYLINQKYNGHRENQIDIEIFDALAEQGAKVLNHPPQELKNYGAHSQPQKKNYAFAYKVLDKATGDDFSHQQIRSAKATNGEYRVKLPDGRLQIVSYKADKNGYKADVKYEEDPEATQQHLIRSPVAQAVPQYVPQNVDISKVPVRQFIPRGRPNVISSYDYVGAEKKQQFVNPLRDTNLIVMERAGPSKIPVNYVDIAVAPTPNARYLIGGTVDHQLQGQHYPKVQIYTTNARDYLEGDYVPTTAETPVYEKKAMRYTSTPIPPTAQTHVTNHGDGELFKLNVISTYSPPVQGPAGHKNVINTVDPSQSPNDAYRHTLEQENDLPEGIYIVGKSGKR